MKKKTKIDKKGSILHFRIIKITKTLWHRFQMVSFSSGIDRNLLLQETKLQLKKNWAIWTKKRLKTVIYMRKSLKNSFQSRKVIH